MKIPPLAQLVFCLVISAVFATYLPMIRFSVNTVVITFVVALTLLGLAFILPAVVSFIKHKTTVNPQALANTTTLVTSGLFGVSRNPMYVGMLGLLLAFTLWLGAISAIVGVAIFFVSINELQIRAEEESLHEIFGDAFDEYTQRVPRWLFFKARATNNGKE